MYKINRLKFSQKTLVRDYIWDNLYKKDFGYFTKKENLQLGELKESLRFFSMSG